MRGLRDKQQTQKQAVDWCRPGSSSSSMPHSHSSQVLLRSSTTGSHCLSKSFTMWRLNLENFAGRPQLRPTRTTRTSRSHGRQSRLLARQEPKPGARSQTPQANPGPSYPVVPAQHSNKRGPKLHISDLLVHVMTRSARRPALSRRPLQSTAPASAREPVAAWAAVENS